MAEGKKMKVRKNEQRSTRVVSSKEYPKIRKRYERREDHPRGRHQRYLCRKHILKSSKNQ